MRFDVPLDDVFAGRSSVRVLRALYALPVGFAASAREVARRAGVSHPTASKVLSGLADQGIAVRRRVPRADLYELDHRYVLTEKLSPLFEWEAQVRTELVSFIRDLLVHHAPWVRSAFLFGSAAREGAEEVGDIDLAVISHPDSADETDAALEQVSAAVEARFGAPLNVLIGARDLGALRKTRGAVSGAWRHVVSEGIPVLDTETEGSPGG